MVSDNVLQLVLTQVWQVALIAVIVWTLTKTFAKNQPQMAHLLWGLVLLKVITPPIWSSPTSVFSWLSYGSYQQEMAPAAMEKTSPHSSTSASTLTISLRSESQAAGLETPSTGTTLADDAASARESSAASAGGGESWVIRSMLKAWIVGVCFLIVASVIRFVSFWRWVRSSVCRSKSFNQKRRQQLEEQIQVAAHAMALRLGIHRKIRVRLIDAPIGPAVVGLFRPAIILPLGIVEHRSVEFLEPLIAHELVHIRRGDLYWAVLQSLSTSLLWFHPLVWLAARRLTLESERSCDEQTIAWLGCSPKAYAQSLIDVLERKHQLRVAPALPGVRPVDVTRKRLERIMKLGHGSRKSTPIWAWAVFLGAVALVLPGAAFVVAQEVVDFSRPPTQPAETSKTLHATEPTSTQIEKVQFEVGDLLESLKASGNSEEQARSGLLSFLPQSVRQPVYRGDPDGNVSESKNATIDGTSLYVVGTPEQIAKVKEAIEERRQLGFHQIALKVTFIRLSKQRMDQLNIPWRKAAVLSDEQFNTDHFKSEAKSSEHSTTTLDITPPAAAPSQHVFYFEDGSKVIQHESSPQGLYQINAPTAAGLPNAKETVSFDVPKSTELQVPAVPMPAFYAIVADDEYLKILDSAQSDKRTNVLHAPRVTAFDGTLIHISDTVQRPFVTGIELIKGESGTIDSPTIQVAVEGSQVVTQPNVDANGNIELLFALNERRIQQVDTFTYDKAVASDSRGNRVETGVTVQIPQLISRFLALKSNLKSGESLFVTSGIPSLEDSRGGAEEVLIAVATASAIRDTAPQASLEDNAPFQDSPIEASQTNHKQTSQSPSSRTDVSELNPEFQGHERYERVPVVGPITAGGQATALDPPTDNEIVQAMQKLRRTRSSIPKFDASQRKSAIVIKEKIADYVDPPRFIPLVGRAQLHHAHYKCTVYSTERKPMRSATGGHQQAAEVVEVVYIDHNHFHLVSNSGE